MARSDPNLKSTDLAETLHLVLDTKDPKGDS